MFNVSIKKLISYFYMKAYAFFKQREFLFGETKVRYILEKGEGKELIIVFSACTRKGIKARYNYITTLQKVKSSKLFILDDFGYDSRGAYYIGSNGKMNISIAVEKLINHMKEKFKYSKTIYVGSSKGGYAALYFGILDETASHILAGAPQYYLGNYLSGGENVLTFKYIIGEINDSNIEKLNSLLKKRIHNSNFAGNVYLNFSDKEHTFQEHIKDLIADLHENGITYKCMVDNYSDHSSISKYFPKFLKEQLVQHVSG